MDHHEWIFEPVSQGDLGSRDLAMEADRDYRLRGLAIDW